MNGRRVFICNAGLLGSGVLMPFLTKAAEAAQLSKAEVQYRDRPHDGKDCDDCVQFVAGEGPKVAGSCKVVAGVISPHGYCLAFTPKPPG
jgi:hypothetical protein